MFAFQLTTDIISSLRQLQEAFVNAYAKLNGLDPDLKLAIHRYAKISMIGASTRIENAVLTDAEIDWIDTILSADSHVTAFIKKKADIENKLSKDRERSIEEVAGCRAMLELIYEQGKSLIPLTETAIRGLHQELLQYYPKAAFYMGQYKTQSNSVIETNNNTKEIRTVFETAPAGPITSAAMSNLVEWYNTAQQNEAWIIAVACEFTYRFLAIHPFQDGNGRLGRGLFLLSLLQSTDMAIREVVPYLAIDRHIEKYRADYYRVLNKCSNGHFHQNPKDYHIEFFLHFMIKVLIGALGDIEIYIQRFHKLQLLTESSQKLLACFKEHPELRLSTQQLIEFTGLSKRTINYSMKQLLHDKFIQRLGRGAAIRYQLIF